MSLFIAQQAVYLHGPCSYLPQRVIDNQAILALTKSSYSKEMIGFSTGIKQRHWVSENQACSDLAIEACVGLFDQYPDLKHAIEFLILATISGDFITPPTSPNILYQLGIKGAGGMDLGAACAGFVTGLHVASTMACATSQSILLVASEVRSKFLNKDDFGSSVLFGDGAASGVLSFQQKDADFQFLGSLSYADGEIYDMVSIPAGGSRNPFNGSHALQDSKITIKNNSVLFVKAVHGMTHVAQQLLSKMNLSHQDIDWVIPHQGNKHLVLSVAKQLGFRVEQTLQSVSTSGNTSGASNGIALAQLRTSGQLKRGQKILLTSAGGGGMAASAVLQAL